MTGTSNEITGGLFHGHIVQAGNIESVLFAARAPVALAGLPAEQGFVGRVEELAALEAALAPDVKSAQTVLVCAMAGLAGVGKTALALRAAHRASQAGWFTGGVLFINLFGYDPARRIDPCDALATLLQALGVSGEYIPTTQAGREVLYRSELARLAEQGRRVLVVADNAAEAGQIEPLRPGSAVHRMLVTSRHTLPLPGARRLEVDVLPHDTAVAVLEVALRAASPTDARLTTDTQTADRLVELCGRLPLALRICAELLADSPGRPADALVHVLSTARTRLDEIAYGDSPAVRTVFDASYQHLPPDQRRLFRLLALCPGQRFDKGAAAALAAASDQAARRLLAGLRRAHLIEPARSYDGYRFHDLLRLYAQECCQRDETPAAREIAIDDLLTYYRDASRAAANHFRMHDTPEGASRFTSLESAFDWFEAEVRNILAACSLAADTQRHAHTCDIAFNLADFFFIHGYHKPTWIGPYQSALAAARHLGDPNIEARALGIIAHGYRDLRRFDEALDHHRQALVLYRQIGDRIGEAGTLTGLGLTYQQTHQGAVALECQQKALAIYQEIGASQHIPTMLMHLGSSHIRLKHYDKALEHLERALTAARQTGDWAAESATLISLGDTHREQHRLEEADGYYRQALSLLAEHGHRRGRRVVAILGKLGETHRQLHHLDEALDYYQRTLAMYQYVGDRHGEGYTHARLGEIHRDCHRVEEAAYDLRMAAAAYEEAGDLAAVAWVRTLIDALNEVRRD